MPVFLRQSRFGLFGQDNVQESEINDKNLAAGFADGLPLPLAWLGQPESGAQSHPFCGEMKRLLRNSWIFVASCLVAAVLATIGASVFGSGLLFGGGTGATVSASIGEYLWALGKYRSQLDELEVRTIRYATGMEPDPARVVRSYRELEAKYQLLAALPPDAGAGDALRAGRGADGNLHELMLRVRDDVMALHSPRDDVSALGRHLDELRRAAEEVATTTHFAEMQRLRASLSSDEERRQRLFKCWVVLWTALLLGVVAYFVDWRRVRRFQRTCAESAEAGARELAQLREEVFAKTTVLGIISHELKSPLQTIISSVDLLANRVKTPRELEVLERLNSGASRLQAHMQDLTEYARLESGRVSPRRMEFAPNELVKRVLNDLKFAAEGKGVRLVQVGPKSDYVIVADAHRIQQILTNLVSNAIKYASEGEIAVTAELVLDKHSERAPWHLRLTVEDDGPGIAPEYLPRLFEPFMQLDNSGGRRLDGAGLGLAIVQRLARLLEGTISVESELGHGTRFTVVVPVDLITSSRTMQEDAHEE